jgi:serine/threonine protein kinase
VKFNNRYLRKSQSHDSQHQMYSDIKSNAVVGDKPYPAIFSVGGVEIRFKSYVTKNPSGEIKEDAYIKPCVYLVETFDGKDALLKITHNYDIESHKTLQAHDPSLAPKIIGYERICDQYHVILMEYMGQPYDTICNYLVAASGDPPIGLDQDCLRASLTEILGKLQDLGIVHGDFRPINILAKRSEDNPAILEDFKLIDFELSGKVDTPYPFLALRNKDIIWHPDFNSYVPRKFDHDKFMYNQIFA